MGRGQTANMQAGTFAPAQALPPGRPVTVRSTDGTRLHAEVFGPDDGQPIVLAHGITCALRVWAHQITDLSRDYRVIAYDHRGHGRSGVPPRRDGYSLDHLAADLDSVLDATVAADERAVVAGHSMGGIAITSWAERYPDRVSDRASAVALINTTTGDLLRDVQLLPVPAALAGARIAAAGTLLKTFGATPVPRAIHGANLRFLSMLAVGRDADPAIAAFVHELFAATPAAGRGGWARTLVDHLGPQHIGLNNLVVPTLVIGSEKDRLLPVTSARRIAREVPNLAEYVELSGGHCAILERPQEVNRQLRLLVDSVAAKRRVTS
ncbi:alpha/beta fold hydrolase [Mycolicibacterium pulveris]|uniref:alpha/beta fold hydrolase n=1 Tax=Mycolicibacterium pulveris TaxID=36813 RepID=UPI003CEED80E